MPAYYVKVWTDPATTGPHIKVRVCGRELTLPRAVKVVLEERPGLLSAKWLRLEADIDTCEEVRLDAPC
jgi:hypothetical protein